MIVTRDQYLHDAQRLGELVSLTSHSRPASAGCHRVFIFSANRLKENLPCPHTLTLAVGFT